MKKVLMTLAIVLTMGLSANAQFSLLGKDDDAPGDRTTPSVLALPSQHGSSEDDTAPLGSGIAVLVSLGAAYMVAKKRNED